MSEAESRERAIDLAIRCNVIVVLKGHQTFITDIVNDSQDYAMVEAINQLAHILGMKTIAESVTNAGVLEALTSIGVDYGQGFGLSEPVELAALVRGI